MVIANLAIVGIAALSLGLFIYERLRRRNVEADSRREVERLGHFEARNAAMLRAVPDMMFLVRRDGVYLDFHATDLKTLHAEPEHFVGRSVRDVLPPDLAAAILEGIARVVPGGEPVVLEYSLASPNGPRYFEGRLTACGDDTVLSMVRDVTDQRMNQDILRHQDRALTESNREIRSLAGRLIAAQEVEQRRIARELHDDISQKLALLAIGVERLPAFVDPSQARQVRDVSARVAEIASDVHRMAYRLHPSKLEVMGLVRATDSYCRELARQHGLDVEFTHATVPSEIDPDIALCLYRIVQEALANVVRHSGANKAWVSLRGLNSNLELRIADPGLGFSADRQYEGLGLVSMRERVHFLGGKFVIRSQSGAGTRIGVLVPCARPDVQAGTPAQTM